MNESYLGAGDFLQWGSLVDSCAHAQGQDRRGREDVREHDLADRFKRLIDPWVLLTYTSIPVVNIMSLIHDETQKCWRNFKVTV